MSILSCLLLALSAGRPEDPPLLPVDELVQGAIEDGDPVVATATLDASYTDAPTVGRAFRVEVAESGPCTIELRSYAFDAYLVLRDADGAVLAEDDDGPVATHAQLAVDELRAGESYFLEACALHGERGPFELLLTRAAPAPLSPVARTELALDDARRRLEFLEQVEGPESPAVASALERLAELLRVRGDYEAARPLLERALAIRETALGPDDLETSASLESLGAVLLDLGDYEAAGALMERALAIRQAALGPDHPATAASLNNLAMAFELMGDLQAARPLYERALATLEASLGPDDPDAVMSLHNLAGLLEELGDYEAARPLLERTLAIRERVLGPDHPETARSLGDLAHVLQLLGDYEAARPLLERALAVREAEFGPRHPAVAVSLEGLAGLLAGLGDYEAARPLQERAAAIHEAALGPEHPSTAGSLAQLAMLLDELGDHRSALPLLERAAAAEEAALGPRHPALATSLNNLAFLHCEAGDYEAARPLLERALAISETALGPDRPQTAHYLDGLGQTLRGLGEYRAARPLVERAVAILEAALEPDHAATVESLCKLASLNADLGEVESAWQLSRRHRDGGEELLAGLSEAESYRYLASLAWQLELRVSLADLLGSAAARVEAYEAVLDRKGRIARFLTASRERLAAEASPEERALGEELRACQRRLSQLALATNVRDREQHEARLGVLRAERNRLEVELRRAGSSRPGAAPTTWTGLRASLPDRSAVVDLFALRRYRPARLDGERVLERHAWSRPELRAWITRPDREELVEVDLGRVEEMEAAIRAFLQDLVQSRGVSVGEEPRSDPAVALRALLWDPLAPYLEGVETIFVSPDGALATLPFETLQLEDGRFLVEEHAFVYLQDVSALARRGDEEEAELDSLLAMGAVDFRRRADWHAEDEPAVEASPSTRGGFSDYWAKLPATGYESQLVHDLHEDTFGEQGRRELLQAEVPTEERLKHDLGRYSVLHLATHGFFQPEGTPSMWESAKNERGRRTMRMTDEARALVGRHPGLLSGLVCAGANRPPEDGGDDGYLTAEEVGWLDLTGVELVVLSACETGLGRAQSGEGLLGLRRAFRIAGARTVVSSLWSVKDDATSRLMGEFYENLWLRGMGRLEALRAAQLAMLARNRMEHGAALPSTWGAFVLSGEWR